MIVNISGALTNLFDNSIYNRYYLLFARSEGETVWAK